MVTLVKLTKRQNSHLSLSKLFYFLPHILISFFRKSPT
nr:MAG TPA: hypothetical protein [Bacteriophage sp.]